MMEFIKIMAHLDVVDHVLDSVVRAHQEERRQKVILTSDQERVIDALSWLGGGWAKVQRYGSSKIAVEVTLAGQEHKRFIWRVMHDGHVICGEHEGPGERLASMIYSDVYHPGTRW